MTKLGQYIRTVREHRGFEQQDVAASLGRSSAWLSDIERGRKKGLPEPEELRAIAGALGVSMIDMLLAAGYLGKADVQPDMIASRNPFPAGDLRHEAVDLLLANDASFEQVVKSVLALRRSMGVAPVPGRDWPGEQPEEERGH